MQGDIVILQLPVQEQKSLFTLRQSNITAHIHISGNIQSCKHIGGGPEFKQP